MPSRGIAAPLMDEEADHVAQFDRLVGRKELLWAPSVPVRMIHHGLHVCSSTHLYQHVSSGLRSC